jgi:amino acid adenylation domain-containing protein
MIWLPLSAAQRSRWFLYQLDPATRGAHNIGFAARVTGSLDAGSLSLALHALAKRHPMLRGRFRTLDGEPQQCVDDNVSLVVTEESVPAHQEEQLRQQVRAAFARPFDLNVGPLLHAHLYHISETETVMLLVFDHLICDGWSFWQIMKELGEQLATITDGSVHGITDQPESASYLDFVATQRDWLASPEALRQMAYWDTALSGQLPVLQFAADLPGPAPASGEQGHYSFHLAPSLVQELHALAGRQAATLYSVLLCAYQILLSFYTSQDEIIVGSPMAGRVDERWNRTVGDFVNPIALRVSIDRSATVREMLKAVRNIALRGMKNQEYPFSHLVERMHGTREAGVHPIFQTMFTLQRAQEASNLAQLWNDARSSDIQWGNRILRSFPLHQSGGVRSMPLSLEALESEGSIRCDFKFDSGRFDESTIAEISRSFIRLLSYIAADENQCVKDFPLLDTQQRQQLLVDFNDTAADFPHDHLVHQLFEAQAAAQPDAVAVVCQDQRLTYSQLNRRANQLAHHLLAVGVRPDDRVAICLERSVDMIVGMMGILKAGAAYLPLDPANPADRLQFMIADGRPVALLTQAALRICVPEVALPVVLLDADSDIIGMQADSDPDSAEQGLNAGHLAYVIYTSGSTGMPKGVMIEHRSVVRLAVNNGFAGLGSHDRVANCASPAFDATTWEIWGALLNGAAVVVVPQDLLLDPSRFGAYLTAHTVSALLLTTGLFHQYASTLVAAFGGLRFLLTGGDALDPHVVRRVLAAPHRPQHLVNAYGPTECTTVASCHQIESLHAEATGVPIGRPIANTQIYILDPYLQPVPLGVTGELYLGGAGVARGYLNRPELTAERFLADSFSGVTNARMYRTGDLGRWLPDGTIEYQGRNDFQVKIRGFRIELGEIEARLAACAGVREAVVLAREDVAGDKRLVAYLVAQDGVTLDTAALRTALAEVLADYMIPSAFVTLDSMPLMANGKLDRRALPAPSQSALVTREYVAPIGATEQALAEIWQDLLGVPRVGRHDHFFELGGHSLLAMQMVSRLRQRLDVELPLRALFTQPTLAGLAAVVDQAGQSTLAAIAPADRNNDLPLSWAQQRLWFLDQLDHAAGAAYHMPAALRLTGALDRDALRATLDRIVARHEGLRTTFAAGASGPVQVIAPAGCGFALAEHDLRGLEQPEREQALAELRAAEAAAPFGLAAGPLIRGQLVRLADDEHILLVTQHHIISDGWSVGVLVKEMSVLYAAFSQGQPDPLPPLAIQYADYAIWQRQWLQGDTLHRQIDFWRTHLEGAPALLELPADRPRPAVQSHAGGSVALTIPAELAAGLRSLAQRHGATLFMTLLGGWSILLARMSGQDDVVIGTPVANRQRTEIEALIGFFVNTLGLRVQLGEDPSVAQLLAQVKASTVAAYSHQDLPFEQVVEALRPPRSMSYSPIFQVMLSLNNVPTGGGLSLPGLTLAPVESSQHTTHFDLSLSLSDQGEAIGGTLEYASDLFERGTIERLAGHFQQVLAAMVADEQQRVSALPLLSAPQRQQLLEGFNDTAAPYPNERLIHQLFEAQAAARPDAIALVYEDQQLTYDQLNRRANQVAHHLLALGVQPDDRVAICAERSLEMVVGVIGILKAGAGYVPLDPSLPQDRLAYMLADSAPVALLTQAALRDRLPAPALPVILLDADGALIGRQADSNPDLQGLTSRHLAYVIYTSGSTGMPKGVVVEHINLGNLLSDWRVQIGKQLDDCQLIGSFWTNYGFDVSLFEAFVPLTLGGMVKIVPESVRHYPQALLDWLVQEAVTHAYLPPFLIRALNDYPAVHMAALPLRVVLVGVESLIEKDLYRLERCVSNLKIINGYGPTEATVFCTSYADIQDIARNAPIGKPIANARIYILDAHAQPVPLGVTGELYIGGAGVARGYLNRPELSAERFLADPFSSVANARMYKTGDRARWLPDGNIEYQGRNDFQVKIRGFRIELGEIEARLAACAGVREAVVLAREDNPGDQRLVAYLAAQEGATLDAAALRSALAQVLADYMIPSAFVTLDSFPLTANGKLDRSALPAPDHSALATSEYVAPIGATEQALAQMWQDLLGLPRVGRHDNFFALGGHSLAITQLAFNISEMFDVTINISQFYRIETLEQAARHLDMKLNEAKQAQCDATTLVFDL